MAPTASERWHMEQQQRLLRDSVARQQANQARARHDALRRVRQPPLTAEGMYVSYSENRYQLGDLLLTGESDRAPFNVPGEFGEANSLVIEVSASGLESRVLPNPALWCWLSGSMSDSDRWFPLLTVSGGWALIAGSLHQVMGQYAAPFPAKLRVSFGVKGVGFPSDSAFQDGEAFGVEVCVGVVRF